MLKLTDQEKQEIIRYLEAGRKLPETGGGPKTGQCGKLYVRPHSEGSDTG